MLKCFFIIFTVAISSLNFNYAQSNKYADSLLTVLKTAKDDTNKVKVLKSLFFEFEFKDIKKADFYAKESLKLAQQLNYKKGIAYPSSAPSASRH